MPIKIGAGVGVGHTLRKGVRTSYAVYLTGTTMDGQDLTVQPGAYTFAPASYSRQMQQSADGATWSNTGSPFSGSTFTINGLTTKYLRVIEAATSATGQTAQSASAAVGPVSALVTLATLPLTAGAKLLSLGHQTVGIGAASGALTGTTAMISSSYSPLIWARYLDSTRVNTDTFFDPVDPYGDAIGSVLTMSPGTEGNNGSCRGVEGDTLWNARDNGAKAGAIAQNTPGVIARLTEALSHNPDIVYLHAGENDINQGRPAREVIQDLDLALNTITKAGIWVIFSTLHPSWPSWSGAKSTVRDEVQTWVLAQSTRFGVKIADMRTVWPDQKSLLERRINQLSTLYYDCVHNVAAYRAAKDIINPLLATMVSSGTLFSKDPTSSNLLPSSIYGMNGGTAGSKSPTTAGVINGSIATGFSLTRLTGSSTVTCTLEDDGVTGRKKHSIAVTASDASAGQRWRLGFTAQNYSTLGLVDGDWVRALVRVEIDNWVGWSGASPKIDEQGGSRWITTFPVSFSVPVATVQAGVGGGSPGVPQISGAAAENIATALDLWLISEPHQIYPGRGNTNFRTTEFIEFSFTGAPGGGGTIKISAPILRKISNPRPTWGMAA